MFHKFCCWPQTFLQSGTWAYYSFSGGEKELFDMEKNLTRSESIGYSIRKILHTQNFIFGDILAHFP
jgi:hypothetical protein